MTVTSVYVVIMMINVCHLAATVQQTPRPTSDIH